MVVYDYSQIETLMTCGDIHGDYKRFFNEIKTHVKSNKKIDEEIHPLIKEEAESKMLNGGLLSDLCFTCDMPRLQRKFQNYENCVIIVAGDCGFGFNKPQYYHDLFHKYNEIFAEVNTTVLFVRGNHDDPTYFDGSVINYSHIKAIPDYSVVLTKNLSTLCVGGAISVDRFWRKQKEVEINKYKTNTQKKLYWYDEAVVYDEEKLMEILNNGIQINSVITHSAPSVAKQNEKDSAIGWFKYDNNLKKDLITERKNLDNLHDFLLKHEQKLLFWVYGHFHVFNETHNEQEKTMYVCLQDNYSFFEPLFEYNIIRRQLDISKLQQEATKKIRRSRRSALSIESREMNPSFFDELYRMATTMRTDRDVALNERRDGGNDTHDDVEPREVAAPRHIHDDVEPREVEAPRDIAENHNYTARFFQPADYEWEIDMPHHPF